MKSYFDGDINKLVMEAQIEEYKQMVWELFTSSRDQYLQNDWFVWIYPDLKDKLAEVEIIEKPILEVPHDLIAASFRYHFCMHSEIRAYPDEFPYWLYYLDAWRNFYKQEIRLISKVRKIQNSIVLHVAYPNTTQGAKAKDDLIYLLRERYPYLYQ